MARLASGNNLSGCPPGVHRTDTGNYQARISLEGKRINLGSFPTAEEAGAAYSAAKTAGFTCKDSPKKNIKKRGTGLRSLATQTLMRYASCVSRCAIVSLLAGVKALKKKGLAPQPNNNARTAPPRQASRSASRSLGRSPACRWRQRCRSDGSRPSRWRPRSARSRRSPGARSCGEGGADAHAASHGTCPRAWSARAAERENYIRLWIGCG